jgi:tetratricopeptide (TPR) repeat protein
MGIAGFMMNNRTLFAALVLIASVSAPINAMTIDLSKLWDYSKPDVSEQRFRDALTGATPDEALILQTQIARTWGIRRDFARARETLAGVAPKLPNASAEANVRYWLELGRTWSSTAHAPESQTTEVRENARAAYMRAIDLAKSAQLDDLAIDALHMMVAVDTDPNDQLEWNLKALDYMEQSTQPAAKAWEGSLRNNVGYALYLGGKYGDALEQFQLSLAARERAGGVRNIRIAHWMIALTLRAMGRLQEALAIQLRLEREWEAAGEPDPYVWEELEHIYRALGDEPKAQFYAQRQRQSK